MDSCPHQIVQSTLNIFSIWVWLENLNDHKEKPLMCYLKPDIYSNKQQKLIKINMKIKKEEAQ